MCCGAHSRRFSQTVSNSFFMILYSIMSFFSNLGSKIASGVSYLGSKASEGLAYLGSKLPAVNTIASTVRDIANPVGKALSSIPGLGSLGQVASGIGSVADFVASNTTKASNALEKTKKAVDTGVSAVNSTFRG